jgi:hypothetical protein
MLGFHEEVQKSLPENVYPYDNLNHIIIKLKMKKSLLLYAFIILLLMNIFTYMFYSKEVAFEQSRWKK